MCKFALTWQCKKKDKQRMRKALLWPATTAFMKLFKFSVWISRNKFLWINSHVFQYLNSQGHWWNIHVNRWEGVDFRIELCYTDAHGRLTKTNDHYDSIFNHAKHQMNTSLRLFNQICSILFGNSVMGGKSINICTCTFVHKVFSFFSFLFESQLEALWAQGYQGVADEVLEV